MFTVEIAGVPIGIDNRYGSVARRCRGFRTSREPLFTVSASQDEMIRESGKPCAVAEELCIYRHIALEMMKHDAFLMHAAVIDIDGQGVAFAARSGTGKTTRLLLWKQAMGERVKVVNGDKPILRFTHKGLTAFDTPWRGKENWGGEAPSTPLRYVVFIERAGEVSVRAMEADEAVPRLFRQVLVPKDPEGLGRFMGLMERLASSVSFYLLKCNREAEQPEMVWRQINKIQFRAGNM